MTSSATSLNKDLTSDVSPQISNNDFNTFYITQANELDTCDFWITTFAEGKASVLDILKSGNSAGIFDSLADVGLADKDAILVSDTTNQRKNTYFLLPESASGTDSSERMIDQLKEAVKAANPVKVGIYMNPTNLDAKESLKWTAVYACSIIEQKNIDICFYDGRYQNTDLINLCIGLKNEQLAGKKIVVVH